MYNINTRARAYLVHYSYAGSLDSTGGSYGAIAWISDIKDHRESIAIAYTKAYIRIGVPIKSSGSFPISVIHIRFPRYKSTRA